MTEPVMSPLLEKQIRLCEEGLLHSDFQNKPQLLEDLLAPGFEEIGTGGRISSREQVITWLKSKDPLARWEFQEFRLQLLAQDLVLASYRAKQVKPVASSSAGSRRSSIWQWSSGRQNWQLLFHQATAIT